MPAARPQTRPMRRCAAGRTGHTEAVLVVYDPKRHQLRGAAEAVLGEPRPDPGHAPGQRFGHPVPLGDLHFLARAAARRRGLARRLSAAARNRRATARSPPRSPTRRHSTSPRTITSNISPRTRTAIAASAAPASPARSRPKPPPTEFRFQHSCRVPLAPWRSIVTAARMVEPGSVAAIRRRSFSSFCASSRSCRASICAPASASGSASRRRSTQLDDEAVGDAHVVGVAELVLHPLQSFDEWSGIAPSHKGCPAIRSYSAVF